MLQEWSNIIYKMHIRLEELPFKIIGRQVHICFIMHDRAIMLRYSVIEIIPATFNWSPWTKPRTCAVVFLCYAYQFCFLLPFFNYVSELFWQCRICRFSIYIYTCDRTSTHWQLTLSNCFNIIRFCK